MMTTEDVDSDKGGPSHKRTWYLRPEILVVAVLSVVVLVLHVRNVFIGFYDHDEIEHLHAAWLVFSGKLPFVDFFEAHQPPLWYMLAPLTGLVGASDIVATGRLAMLPFAALTLIATKRLIFHLIRDHRIAWFATLMLPATWVFARTILEVRPDVPQFALMVFSLERYVVWTINRRNRTAFVSGVAAGLAVAFLHKAVVLFGGIAFGTIMIAFERNNAGKDIRRLALSLIMMTAGALIPVLGMYLAMAVSGMLPAYRFLAFDFMSAIQTGTSLELHFSPLSSLISVFRNSPGIFLVGLPGLVLMAKRIREPGIAAVFGTLISALVLIMISRMPFKQFFLPVWLGLAVSGAVFMVRLAGSNREKLSAVRFVPGIVVIVSLLMGIGGLWINPTNVVHKAVAERIVAVTGPEDTVFAQPPWHPIVREDAGFLWFDLIDFLAALDFMDIDDDSVAGEIASKMRDVLARPPKAVFVSSPGLRRIEALGSFVENDMFDDPLVRNLHVR